MNFNPVWFLGGQFSPSLGKESQSAIHGTHRLHWHKARTLLTQSSSKTTAPLGNPHWNCITVYGTLELGGFQISGVAFFHFSFYHWCSLWFYKQGYFNEVSHQLRYKLEMTNCLCAHHGSQHVTRPNTPHTSQLFTRLISRGTSSSHFSFSLQAFHGKDCFSSWEHYHSALL